MRIDSIIQELNKRAIRNETIANGAYCMAQYDIYIAAARALRGAITLIESYKTDDDSPTDKEA